MESTCPVACRPRNDDTDISSKSTADRKPLFYCESNDRKRDVLVVVASPLPSVSVLQGPYQQYPGSTCPE